MGKKIRSFLDYDAMKRQRKEQFKQEVETRLEKLVLQELRNKGPPEHFFFSLISRPQKVLQIMIRGEREVFRQYLEGRKKDILYDAQRNVTVSHFQSNLHDLIVAAVHASRQNKGYLAKQEKRDLYARFLDLLQEFGDTGFSNGLFSRYPEARHLIARPTLPFLKEQKERLRAAVEGFRREKYLTSLNQRTLMELLFTEEATVIQQPASLPRREEQAQRPSSPEAPPGEESSPEGCKAYLLREFLLNEDTADNYAARVRLQEAEMLHRELERVVGEEYAILLINDHPDILLYPAEGILNKYVSTIQRVLKEVKRGNRNGKSPEEELGMEKNLSQYSCLENVLALKQRLCAGKQVSESATSGGETAFDLEGYKDQLLQKAGLDLDIVRAFTEGKTALFKGEFYVPQEYFRKNAIGKVERQKLDLLGESVFNRMVRAKAITRKHKANPVYRLNPHLQEITNFYLREYMRVTLYHDQIVAQEGEIKPNPDVWRELYKGKKQA